MSERFECHIPVLTEISVLELLFENTSLGRQQIKRVMKNGAVWHKGHGGIDRLRRARKLLSPGDEVHLYYDEEIQAIQPPEAQLIEDRGAYSVWNKPSGMWSQGSRWGDHCTLYRYAEQHLLPQRPAFTVHRLDRAANGLMLIAHSKKMARLLSQRFENHQISKQYHATLEGLLQVAELPLEINEPVDGKSACSRVVRVEHNPQEKLSQVWVEIDTGRKHQVRRHMALLGHPIRGDRLTGAKDTSVDLQLTACRLKLICPETGEEVEWCIEP